MNIIKGDITNVTEGVILHGVNSYGIMGSGVALALVRKWPKIEDHYRGMCNAHDTYEKKATKLLGSVDYVYIDDDHDSEIIIANGFTQVEIGMDMRNPFNNAAAWPHAVFMVLTDAANFACDSGLPLHTVKIGSLRGGLPWELVESMMLGIEAHFGADQLFNLHVID